MSYGTIGVTPVTPRIGAYVEGVTLAKPLSNRQVEELHQALAQHQALWDYYPQTRSGRRVTIKGDRPF